MSVKLYKMDQSPPSCAAMMMCEIHNVPVEMLDVNLLKQEHLKPEYVKKHPLHTIPMLEDGSLYVQDSHVILTYLTDKYGKDDSLYPKDLRKRAQVDQKLYFDMLFFGRLRNISAPAFFEGVRRPPEKVLSAVVEALDFLETFLNNTKFVAGDKMTIADISLASTVAFASCIIDIDEKKYPKIKAWFSYMENQPFYQKRAAAGLKELKELLHKYLDL